MNIAEIKAKLGRTSIDFSRGSKPNPVAGQPPIPTVWLKNWDNEARISIVAHEDVIEACKAGATNLILKTEQCKTRKPGETKETASGDPYVQYTICTASSIETTL